MQCYNCGNTIDDTASFCRFCGANQSMAPVAPVETYTEPVTQIPEETPVDVVDQAPVDPHPSMRTDPWAAYEPEPQPVYIPEPQPVYQPEPQPAFQPAYQPAYQPSYQPQYSSAPVYTDQGVSSRPVLQLPTHRSLVKMIFLPLVTLGIYGMVIWSRIVTELNIVASRHDGKRTMSYLGMTMLAPLTLGIHSLVWIHGFCNRIGDELNRRNIPYKFSAATFWLWNVLGSLIIVGPFIYTHKLMKSMNLINADFNQYG